MATLTGPGPLSLPSQFTLCQSVYYEKYQGKMMFDEIFGDYSLIFSRTKFSHKNYRDHGIRFKSDCEQVLR